MEQEKFAQRLRIAKLVGLGGIIAAASAAVAYDLITGAQYLQILLSALTGMLGV